MRHSTMTIDHFKKVVILFCVIALISFSCKKNDVPTAENSSSTQVNEKASPQKADASKAQNVVVEVNGIKLTQKQVDEKMNILIAAIKNRVPPDRIEEVTRDLREKVIADFITRTVVNQEADKHNITASEDEVNATLSKLEKNLPEDMTLEAVLTQGGMSMEDMQDDIIFSVRINKLMESQSKDDTKPSDEEIKKYYTNNKKQFSTPETVHARHILMKEDEKDDEKTKGEKKATIEGLRKQLLEGADFEKLAKENSNCPSGKKGGDLGTFPRGRMVKPFEEAAFSQKVNDIGPIVQTKFGYHIIQVLAHNQATEKKLDDETKEKITATMVAKKRQELAKNYINKLKENAKIVYTTEDTSKE